MRQIVRADEDARRDLFGEFAMRSVDASSVLIPRPFGELAQLPDEEGYMGCVEFVPKTTDHRTQLLLTNGIAPPVAG